ncbi:MAG: hypothetical protein HOQ45_08190 [Nocardioidaceae bacterium]|nr:hypothetical protein [Nocardioidaceae bacterium]
MRRRTFDALMTTAGLVLAGVLAIGGGLLLWAHGFVQDQVTSQLTAQQIYFPAPGSEALQDPAVKPYLSQYAGQQLTTGAQAKAYADHFIAVHIDEMTQGRTYAELSAKAQANPDDQELAGLVATVFKGETLRGMLLNAYAFGQMAVIALWGAVAAFTGAGLLLVLSLAGAAHLRRTPAEAEVRIGLGTRAATA